MTVYLDKPRNGGCNISAGVRFVLHGARKQCGWDTRELARRIGITEIHLKRLEAGTASPRYETLERWAKAVGCKVTLSVEVER